MKNIKIRVKNEEHSKAIQKRLFELGVRWCNKDTKKALYTTLPYLFSDGRFLTYSDDNKFFNNHDRDWETNNLF